MKKIAMLYILFLVCHTNYAQEGTVSSGGKVSNASGEVSYSIGQIVYTAAENANHSIIQGVQQPIVNNTFAVTDLKLQCTNQTNNILLQWKTETEVNADYFSVEKSTDGEKFLPIGKVTATGNSSTRKNYVLTDYEPFNGRNYYRIQEMDKDGKYMYSNIASTLFGKTISIVYPNPTSGNVTVRINNFVAESLSYKLLDVQGKTLGANNITASETIIELNAFPAGTYLLNLIDKNNSITKTFKLIKNK